RFGHILSAVNWSSDAAFWPVLVEHLPPRGAGVTNLGNTPHYMTVLFLLATRALPGHRTIWAWSPLVTSLAGVALVAWASRRAFGRGRRGRGGGAAARPARRRRGGARGRRGPGGGGGARGAPAAARGAAGAGGRGGARCWRVPPAFPGRPGVSPRLAC